MPSVKKKSKRTRPSKSARLKSTVSKRSSRPEELQYISWSNVALEDLSPAIQRQMVWGQQIMAARVLIKKGGIVPEHSHPNEQLTYILDGALKFWIDGKEITVHSGEVLCIPANMPHKAEAIEDTIDLDIFTPPRADWINRSDQYLRGEK